VQCPEPQFEFPPLSHPPLREQFKTKLKPLPPFPRLA
jgi:hypothetical protein